MRLSGHLGGASATTHVGKAGVERVGSGGSGRTLVVPVVECAKLLNIGDQIILTEEFYCRRHCSLVGGSARVYD